MGDGRTPTLRIQGRNGNPGDVLLEDARSAYPFPSQGGERLFEERWTRPGGSNSPARRRRVYRQWSGPEDSLEFSATVTAEQMVELRAIYRSAVPYVTVTYLHETWPGELVAFGAVPDELGPHDGSGPLEYIITARLDRDQT